MLLLLLLFSLAITVKRLHFLTHVRYVRTFTESLHSITLSSVPTARGMSVKEVSSPAAPSSDHVTSVAVKTARPGNSQSRRISQRGKDQTMSEKTESVPEDVDQSVAESIDTDIGADFAPDEDSVAEIISQDSRRKESKEGYKQYCLDMCYCSGL